MCKDATISGIIEGTGRKTWRNDRRKNWKNENRYPRDIQIYPSLISIIDKMDVKNLAFWEIIREKKFVS